CKINSLIRYKYQEGERIFLFFLETDNGDAIERELVNSLHPPVNLI
ncbi:MAG: GIY-YIG nuclease family protein, partial [Clostridiaceae bacterium]|nr:GIY-YIG nuclease family protein [Clostridiaceae bacterium]